MPSAVSIGVSRCWLRRACTMSSAFKPMSTPPATLNAPMVIPKILKIMLPPKANAVSVMAQVHAPPRASTRRCCGESRAVIARKVGMTANGSTMKKTDVKIRSRSITRPLMMCDPSDRYLNDAILPHLLGVIHRLIGPSQQVVGAGIGRRTRHNADTRRHVRCSLEDIAESSDEPFGGGIRKVCVGLRHQHRKLVAAESADDI